MRAIEVPQQAALLGQPPLADADLQARLEQLHRALQAERAERAQNEVLFRVTDATSRASSLEEIYQAALDALEAGVGVERSSVLLFDADGVMRFKAWRGLSEGYRAAVEGHSPWKPDERDPAPILVEDVCEDPALRNYLAVFAAERIGALAFFPLVSNGLLLGKFMLYYPGPHLFTEAETRLAQGIAHQVAFAVDRRFAHQERDRILGIVSHDLKNPLTAVTVAAATLLRQDPDERMAQSLRRIASGARRMERLIAQLLEFAQARHGGGIPIHRKPTELCDLVAGIVDELRTGYPQNTILLERPGEASGTWDPDRIGEVFSNLIGNAVQHGAGTAVRVTIGASPAEVTVVIHNGGPAIPAGILPKLFDPYQRGASAHGAESVGLGLFISREIVSAHGGTIEARSDATAGTTFTVRLPR